MYSAYKSFGFPSSNKPYYPLVLGNGTDLVPIDLTGSQAWRTQIEGFSPFWLKQERHQNASQLLPLLRFRYAAIGSDNVLGLPRSQQYFDSRNATIHTQVQFKGAQIEIETFLTDDHLLVEHYRIAQLEHEDFRLVFILDRTAPPDIMMQLPDLSSPLKYMATDHQIHVRYINKIGTDFQGVAQMGVSIQKGADHIDTTALARHSIHKVTNQECGLLLVKGCRCGDELTRYGLLLDSLDTDDWQQTASQTMQRAVNGSYDQIRKTHRNIWQSYSDASGIDIQGEDELCELNRYNLYLFRAAQHPKGPHPTGIPLGHGTRYFWDHWFCQNAQLRANHVDSAKRSAYFYRDILPIALQYAQQHNVSGAYYPWMLHTDGIGKHTGQIHNHAVITMLCWDCYVFTGDKNLLNKLYPIMLQAMTYLVENVLQEGDEGFSVRPVRAVDESDYLRENPSWTTAAIFKGLQILSQSANILRKPLDIKYPKMISDLYKVLLGNYKDHVLYPDPRHDEVTHGSLLPFRILFDLPDLQQTLRQTAHSEYGLIPGTTGNGAAMRVFTWIEGWMAEIHALRGDCRALKHLRNLASFTNCFGGIPEIIWQSGTRTRHNFLATHGCFSNALSSMMARADQNAIYILSCFPDQWKDIQVRNVRVEGGLLVSYHVHDSQFVNLQIENTSPTKQIFEVRCTPLKYKTNVYELAPEDVVELNSRNTWE